MNTDFLPEVFSLLDVYRIVKGGELLNKAKSLEELYQIVFSILPSSKKEDILKKAYKIKVESEKLNIKHIHFFSEDYPVLLKQIYDPPVIFYYKGNLNLLQQPLLAVTGTRSASIISTLATKLLPNYIKKSGYTGIASGTSRGLEKQAILECLNKNIPILIVLTTSLEKDFPFENKKVYQNVADLPQNLIISELPVGSGINKWSFPRRNRILTGISKALLVLEAPEQSGVLSSVSLAISQNREILVFIDPSQSRNQSGFRLVEEGATKLCMIDFLNKEFELIHFSNILPNNYNSTQKVLADLSRKEISGEWKELGGGYFLKVSNL